MRFQSPKVYIYSKEANDSVHNTGKNISKNKKRHSGILLVIIIFFSATGIIVEFSSCLLTLHHRTFNFYLYMYQFQNCGYFDDVII